MPPPRYLEENTRLSEPPAETIEIGDDFAHEVAHWLQSRRQGGDFVVCDEMATLTRWQSFSPGVLVVFYILYTHAFLWSASIVALVLWKRNIGM